MDDLSYLILGTHQWLSHYVCYDSGTK
ncbi:hypothetical protein A2U01_0052429, partial [Trifolium medium]|nr:hypothetical protein [Trifolium medium]